MEEGGSEMDSGQDMRIEGDHSSKPEFYASMESQGIYIPGSSWSKGLPEVYVDTLDSNDVSRSANTISGSEPPCTTSPYNGNDAAGVMVEELTVRKHLNSHLNVVDGSHKMEVMQNRQGHWQHLFQLAGGSRNGRSYGENVQSKNKEPVKVGRSENNMFQFSQNHQNYKRPSEDGPDICGGLMSRDNYTTPDDNIASKGNPHKVILRSGFSQFFGKNLKKKAVVSRNPEIHGCDGGVLNQTNANAGFVTRASSNSTNSNLEANDLALRTSSSSGPAMFQDGISLREWLKPGRREVNKAERLNIFRQIVELMDMAHSQQVTLKDVGPSCFWLTPSNEIKYVGSLVQQDCLESVLDKGSPNSEHPLNRKRYLEHDAQSNSGFPSKVQKLSESMEFGRQKPQYRVGTGLNSETVMKVHIDVRNDYGFHIREQHRLNREQRSWNSSSSPSASNTSRQQLASLNCQLEEKWYRSPEELNGTGSTFPSNIYRLGVLLFELLCCFESWEALAAAMSDLRHRILPPNFLSEYPKEAGFCLWLLHPESSSRPTAREVRQSELMLEFEKAPGDQLAPSLDEDDAESDLLLHFLLSLNEQKQRQASKLLEEIGCLDADVAEAEKRHFLRTSNCLPSTRKSSSNLSESGYVLKEPSGSEVLSRLSSTNSNETRLLRNINQLENAYFCMRSRIQLPDNDSKTRSDNDLLKKTSNENEDGILENKATDPLGSFFDGLCKYARYSKFELCSTLRNSDILNSANVICSLSFDRDEDYFATAGVSKKIKIFEFDALLKDTVDIHYPVAEMMSKSKLSCVCWNNYIKNYLASTDYDGLVQLWDATTGQGFSQYLEHVKRAWSVDFSQVDPTKFASGSDDCTVKLWSINEQKCTSTIRNIANVCCVQFSSHSTNLLAFGSADYKTYCYDLRNTRIPWCVLAGHGKAVSYVKFLDSETLVSASTDNTLRLWDLNKTNPDEISTNACSLTFEGHTNEKNFVGLSVSDGYIACGSETNEVFAYYRSLPMPITSYKFGSIDPISGQETGDGNGQFVSSVCWRKKSNMVVSANSTGSIKLLKMV